MLGRFVSASTLAAALLLFVVGSFDPALGSTHVRIHVHDANETANVNSPALDLDLDSAHFSPTKAAAPKVCGANGMLNIKCANEDIQMRANAVVRVIHTYGPGYKKKCTGWLWGNKGHIITSTHCIVDQKDVNESAFEFGVEMPKCSATDTCELYKCPVAEFIPGRGNVRQIHIGKHWTLLRITRGADKWVRQYGYLQLRTSAPMRNEVITIVEHPDGGPKVYARTEDEAGKAMPKVNTIKADPKYSFPTFRYTGDTTNDGSPGAPILSFYDKNLVIGVHFDSDCYNFGLPSDYLVEELKQIKGVDGNDGFKDGTLRMPAGAP